MSQPRIERAEILSLRLVVPLRALDRLRESCPLPLQLERSEHALTLAHDGCSLSFRREGEVAQLSDARIQADARGTFFRDVLCALMTEHAGDLHAKLAWRASDPTTGMASAEVRIRRGQAQTAMTPAMRNVVDNLRQAAEPLFQASSSSSSEGGGGEPPRDAEQEQQPADPDLLEEIDRLLETARKEYAEYLRLKRARSGS